MANKKVISSAALTGAIVANDNCECRPVTPDQIAEDAVRVVRAGASIVHIHARNDDLSDTLAVSRFREIMDAIRNAMDREKLDVLINLSTSCGSSGCTDDERIDPVVALRPEICSYDAGTLNWNYGVIFVNTPYFLEKLGRTCTELGVKPEMEIFDAGMMDNVEHYVKAGILKAPVHYQFMMGVGGALSGRPENIQFLKSKLPEGSTWSVSGIGKCHLDMMFAGLAYGADGLRVGLEDNIYLAHGVKATNEQLVARCAELCRIAQREPANAAEARELLNIPAR